MLTIHEVAAMLNGREYITRWFTHAEATQLRDAGIVVAHGESDDLLEFFGALNAEIGAHDGTTAYVYSGGVFDDDNDRDEDLLAEIGRRGVEAAKARCAKIEAIWCPINAAGKVEMSWLLKTDMPHATFDLMEDDGVFCRGIVFLLADLPVIPELAA